MLLPVPTETVAGVDAGGGRDVGTEGRLLPGGAGPLTGGSHSSTPCGPSLAAKNSAPLTLVRYLGWELAAPGKMSLTRAVPVEVPLLCQSS
jgi:hypothetical protein